MKWPWRILDLVAGGLFIYAGVLKAMEPAQFAEDIFNYRILAWRLSVPLAFLLPWLEIVCGMAVIVRRLYSGALSLLFAMVIVFTGATVAAKVRGLDITCGCFGTASAGWNFGGHMAALLGLLLIFALLLWRNSRSSPGPQPA